MLKNYVLKFTNTSTESKHMWPNEKSCYKLKMHSGLFKASMSPRSKDLTTALKLTKILWKGLRIKSMIQIEKRDSKLEPVKMSRTKSWRLKTQLQGEMKKWLSYAELFILKQMKAIKYKRILNIKNVNNKMESLNLKVRKRSCSKSKMTGLHLRGV